MELPCQHQRLQIEFVCWRSPRYLGAREISHRHPTARFTENRTAISARFTHLFLAHGCRSGRLTFPLSLYWGYCCHIQRYPPLGLWRVSGHIFSHAVCLFWAQRLLRLYPCATMGRCVYRGLAIIQCRCCPIFCRGGFASSVTRTALGLGHAPNCRIVRSGCTFVSFARSLHLWRPSGFFRLDHLSYSLRQHGSYRLACR